MTIENKKVILAVTGSIAIYKSCQLLRRLKEKGAEVKVVMTKSATEFIAPLTFQTLSENPVYIEMFKRKDELIHIKLTEWADFILVAPSTANIISKVASGIADDLLSTLLLSFRKPIFFAPAMDEGMYKNPILKENLKKLEDKGNYIIPAVKGSLASGKIGEGRLASLEDIIEHVERVLLQKEDFEGVKILLTAGGTREYLDPIRFIGNPSSGKMGYGLAEASKMRGAKVILISAPTLFSPPEGIKVINVTTAFQMRDEVFKHFPSSDVLIMASAVGDFRPEKLEESKRKRSEGKWDISLIPNPDILSNLKKQEGQVVVGFSVEIKDEIEKAREKLKEKKMDLVVANKITTEDSGFEKETNRATLIDKYGTVEELPLLTKLKLAHKILDKIKELKERSA